MNIVIRVDASIQIGTGHFTRCLTLANALKRRGAQICFICRFLPDHLQVMLHDKGHDLRRLSEESIVDLKGNLAHAQWLGTSQEHDAQMCLEILSGQKWNWLIVDSYALDASWEAQMRQLRAKILVIDDIADRTHDCDMLLDQNHYADMETRYSGRVPSHCQLLLGPRYAILRDEFRQLRTSVGVRTKPVKKILVFFGGVDKDNYTERSISVLSRLDMDSIQIDVVIGEQHPYRKAIESLCTEHQFICHVQTERMAELLAAADLSIGAGGSAIWERCCLGLPTVVVSTADNQVNQVAGAALAGWIYSLPVTAHFEQTLERHLSSFLQNNYLRGAISKLAMRATDGRGVLRILGQLACGDIEMVDAGPNDIEQIFNWRNHESIRSVSRNSATLSWEEHKNWYSRLQDSTTKILLIGKRNNVSMGVVRFDIENAEAEISIYVVPGITEEGVGSSLLQAAEMWLRKARGKVEQIRAQVLAENNRSRRLFLSAGYQLDSAYYTKRLH